MKRSPGIAVEAILFGYKIEQKKITSLSFFFFNNTKE
jgi:hypothetical protein